MMRLYKPYKLSNFTNHYPNMANDYFQFKQFTIRQEKCAMKVGTDGVLLGSWANLTDARRLLDIGTGTGLIAIMAAQRNPELIIDAIEIDPAAFEQARENANSTPWRERIHIFQGKVQEFTPTYKYDIIICNPPFFINSTKNPEFNRTLARHCETLSHEDLLQVSDNLLLPKGKLCVILPVNEAKHFLELTQGKKWFVNKLSTVYPTPDKAPKRQLIELSKVKGCPVEDSVILEIERHTLHENYANLTRDFYLKL